MSIRAKDIIQLHAEGCTDMEMADILGTTPTTIKYWRDELGLERNKTYRRFHKVYTIIDGATKDVLFKGEASECAEFLGMRTESFRCLSSRCRRGLTERYIIEVAA